MHLSFVKYNKGPQSFIDEARRTTLNSVLPRAEITQKGHNEFIFVLSIEVCFLCHPTPKQRHKRYIWKYKMNPIFIKEIWLLRKPKSLVFSFSLPSLIMRNKSSLPSNAALQHTIYTAVRALRKALQHEATAASSKNQFLVCNESA